MGEQRAAVSAALLLSAPWAGLPPVILHLAEETSPSVGRGLGVDEEPGASCRELEAWSHSF